MAKTEHHTLQNLPKVVPRPHCSTAKPHLPAEIKRPGKDEYRQGAILHPCLADFSVKRTTCGRGPKTKKLTRQGKAKTRQGKVMLFYTTSLIAVLMFARGLSHDSSTRHITRVVQYHADWKTHHPCDGSVNNGTIPTGKYLILCIVPTEEELREQLKDIGGLNRHYAAVTMKEAENFTNLLPGPRPPIPDGEEKPFLIIWSHLTSALSRNRKAVSRDADLENNIVNSKKVRCVYRGGRTEFGMIRLCTECQRVSKLSPDRFPRYINEVACDEEIPSRHKGKLCCKKNQGRCIQRFILSDFLVSTENYVEVPSPNPEKFSKAFKQVWEPYTQKIRSCCEFQLW